MKQADHLLMSSVFAVLLAFLAATPVSAQDRTVPSQTAEATAVASPPMAPPVEPPVIDEPLGEVDPTLYQGTGDRNLRAYRPEPLAVVSRRDALADTERWAMVVRADAVELVRGAQTVRTVPLPPGGEVTIPELHRSVADPRWIEEVDEGIYLLKAALAHGPDVGLVVGGDGVSEVRLADRPDVFIGGTDGAQGRITDTTVVGWDERARAPDAEHERSRPFILYTNSSRLDVEDTELSHLGYDRVGAYGLSWRDRATGSVRDSDVHHLFFGMYSFEGDDIRLVDSSWHHNVYYGIDPHDATTITITGNDAYENGSHGIILSRHVDDAVVRDNHSHDNAGNGIVLDFSSDRALVESNLVEDNVGDGIVVLGSSDALVRDNTVTGHRVGLRVNLPSRNNRFVANRVEGNEYGAQLYDGARGTELIDNIFRDSPDTGVVAEAAGTSLRGGEISGAGVGVDVRGIATADGVTIRDVARGVEVRPTGIFTGRELDIVGNSAGVQVAAGGVALLLDSTIEAPDPIVGPLEESGNQLTQPLSTLWLVWAGGTFMVLAVVLQLLHHMRNRRRTAEPERVVAPPGVTNAR